MFNFDDLDEAVPSAQLEEENLAAARRAADRAAPLLQAQAFNERRSACEELGQLGEAARPYLRELVRLAELEEDIEVRGAARHALRTLRAAGVCPALEQVDEVEVPAAHWQGSADPEAEPAVSSSADPGDSEWTGPRALFEVMGEVLSMRLEPGGGELTPAELLEVWEQRWGVQFAQRLRLQAPPGSAAKWLHPRNDVVPRSPFVVKVHATVGSILYALAGALKVYGRMSLYEADAERERRKLELEKLQLAVVESPGERAAPPWSRAEARGTSGSKGSRSGGKFRIQAGIWRSPLAAEGGLPVLPDASAA